MTGMLTRAVTGVQDWINDRAPSLMPTMHKHLTGYYAPKNFNLWYYFGSLALLVLVNQIVTGIFLTHALQAQRRRGLCLGGVHHA